MSSQGREHGGDGPRHWCFYSALRHGRWLVAGSWWLMGGEILRDLLLRSAREDAARVILDVPPGLRFGVFLLDEQPFVALAPSAH